MSEVVETSIIKIDGLKFESVKEIKESFKPFLEVLSEWREKALEMKVTQEDDIEGMTKAKEARLLLKKVRVESDKVRKELKAESLAYGNAVQNVYNTIEAAVKPLEAHLQEQEDFAKLREMERHLKLKAEREAKLEPYADFVVGGVDLIAISEGDFLKLLNGAKMQKEAADKEAAEVKAREEREAEERRKADEEAAEKRAKEEKARLKAEALEEARLELEREKQREAEAKAKKEAEAKAKLENLVERAGKMSGRERWKAWRASQSEDPIIGYVLWEVETDEVDIECWMTQTEKGVEPTIYQFFENGFQEWRQVEENNA